MKPVVVLVVVSLLGNVALGVALLNKRSVSSSASSSTQSQKANAIPDGDATARTAAAEALSVAMKTNDPAGVRDQLRALGLPDELVRNVVRAMVYKKFSDAQSALNAGQVTPYWRGGTGPGPFGTLTKEQRAKLQEANRAAMKQMEELVGPDPLDPTMKRYSFLSPEKAAKARELERDYNDLRSQIMAETEGFRLPSDGEKLAYLEKEQRKDLAALLSPEELEAYDMRNSSTANRLRFQLRDFDASESEYKAIFAAQKAFDDRFNNYTATANGGPTTREDGQARMRAQEEMNAQLKATLGEDRFNAYMRSQNPEYRTLEAAAKRFNLPSTAVEQAYSAREQAVTAAQRIASDANLNDDQRTQALAGIAEQTRSKIKSTLGSDVADVYLKTNMRWLDALQRGQPIAITPDGNVYPKPPPRPSVSAPPLPPGAAPKG